MATNLYEYYTSQGQNLPSVQERAVIYEQKGLGKASDYKGTASQNTQLLGALNPKQMAGNKPTVSPVTITGDIAEGKIKEATKGIEKIKIEPSKPKTYDEQLQEIATTGETLESDFLKEINNIRKGNIKYTADEQAQLDFITQSIANAQNAQEKFNRQAERGTRLLSVGEFAPVRQQSALNQTIQSGLDEIKNINLEGAAKLGEARQAIRDKRFDEIVKTYGELNAMQDRRSKIIQQLRDNAMELEKFEYQKMTDARDYQLQLSKLKQELSSSNLKNLSGDASKVLAISTTLPTDIQKIKDIINKMGYKKAILAYKSGTNRELVKLVNSAADKVGRLRSGGAINKVEEKRFKQQFISLGDLFSGDITEATNSLDRIVDEADSVSLFMDPTGKYRTALGLQETNTDPYAQALNSLLDNQSSVLNDLWESANN